MISRDDNMGLKGVSESVFGLTCLIVTALNYFSPFTSLIFWAIISINLVTGIINVMMEFKGGKWTHLFWLMAGFSNPMAISMLVLLDFMFKNTIQFNVGIRGLGILILPLIMILLWLAFHYLTACVFSKS